MANFLLCLCSENNFSFGAQWCVFLFGFDVGLTGFAWIVDIHTTINKRREKQRANGTTTHAHTSARTKSKRTRVEAREWSEKQRSLCKGKANHRKRWETFLSSIFQYDRATNSTWGAQQKARGKRHSTCVILYTSINQVSKYDVPTQNCSVRRNHYKQKLKSFSCVSLLWCLLVCLCRCWLTEKANGMKQ